MIISTDLDLQDHMALILHYSTGVQIVSCTLSRDSVLSESTGSFNEALSVSAKENSFDKKINQSDCVFQLMLGLEEHYSPSPLDDFNRLFECLIEVLFKLWHCNIIYILNEIILAKKCKFVSLICL